MDVIIIMFFNVAMTVSRVMITGAGVT